MFGLGLWEWLAIVFLAALVFGPRFLVNAVTSLWTSVTGFGRSFQQASASEQSNALPSTDRPALKAASEETGASAHP